MKLIESSIFHVVDEPLDAIEIIRKKSMLGDEYEEPLYICNISDIIEKYANWQRCMPRVIPFYGELIIDVSLIVSIVSMLLFR